MSVSGIAAGAVSVENPHETFFEGTAVRTLPNHDQIRAQSSTKRRQLLNLLALLPLSAATFDGLAAEPVAPLKLGIMPFNSALALIKTHQPLTTYLEKQLKRKITIYTAPDYVTYVKQLLAGDFDLAIAGPHFGAMASEQGQVPLFRYRAELLPLFVVRNESPVTTLKELRGKRIGLSSNLSISSIGGLKWLHDHGYKPGRDYQLREFATHGAAIAAVAVGELDAAVTTYTPLRQVPPDIRAVLRTLETGASIPHLMTLANASLGNNQIALIRAALESFQSSPEGIAFFRDTGYVGYAPVSAEDIASLQPLIELTRSLLDQAK